MVQPQQHWPRPGRMNQLDQASRLRSMISRAGGSGHAPGETVSSSPVSAISRRSTHVIAVVSGKGGVGKTLLAANLSISLSARGYQVVLFDMDMGLANADIVLGVDAPATWSDVLGGRRSWDDVVVAAPGGLSFIPGSSGVSRMANLSDVERRQLLAAMRTVEDRYDVCVLDCGAGISRNVVKFAASADTILVVTTPEPTAIADAYAMIKAFAQERDRCASGGEKYGSIGVVVNQAVCRHEGRNTYERLAGVAARFLHLAVTDYGYVLDDDHVPLAVRQRHPVLLSYPRCSASSCLMAIAGRLSRDLGPPGGSDAQGGEGREGLLYRVMRMFI